MASIIQTKLNLVPGAAPGGILPQVRVSQGDAEDRIVQFELFDGTTAADMTDVVDCYIGGTKPDGNGFAVSCTLASNVATAVLTDQATVLAGSIRCKLYLLSATGSVRSASFDFDVDPDPLADAGTSDTDITAIVQAAAMYAKNAAEFAEEAASAAQTVVDEYPYMGGATAENDGTRGFPTIPQAGQENCFFKGNASWEPLSYVGMIIHSTTLDTMAKVVEFYGGTTWILHDGYMLRGASTGVTDNRAQSDGGQDSITPTGTNTSGAVGAHTLITNELASHYHLYGRNSVTKFNPVTAAGQAMDVGGDPQRATSSTGGGQSHSHGFTQPTFTGNEHTNLPAYKNVYIWERTA